MTQSHDLREIHTWNLRNSKNVIWYELNLKIAIWKRTVVYQYVLLRMRIFYFRRKAHFSYQFEESWQKLFESFVFFLNLAQRWKTRRKLKSLQHWKNTINKPLSINSSVPVIQIMVLSTNVCTTFWTGSVRHCTTTL